MRNKTFKAAALIILFANSGFLNAEAQVSDKMDVNFTDTPFAILTQSQPNSRLKSVESFQNLNPVQKLGINDVAGRHVKGGMTAYEYSDHQGGHITVLGLNKSDQKNADQMIYKIPARLPHATNLKAQLEHKYGPPDKVIGNEKIWYIPNVERKHGQAKIITMRLKQVAGELVISADRTPITRRGQLLVKPVRQQPVKLRNPEKRQGKAKLPKLVEEKL